MLSKAMVRLRHAVGGTRWMTIKMTALPSRKTRSLEEQMAKFQKKVLSLSPLS